MPQKKERSLRRKTKKGAGPIKNLKRLFLLLIFIFAGAIFYEIYFDHAPEEKLPPKVHRSISKHHGDRQRTEPQEPKERIIGEVPPAVEKTPHMQTPVAPPEKVHPFPSGRSSGPKIAIVIDDIGVDLSPVKILLKIEAPISFAILPHTPHSVEAAELIHKAGRDILLHLPMEPQNYPKAKPGAGSLFTTMNEKEIRQIVNEDIKAVPYIAGVNNHMGSRFTEDEEKLAVVMKELKSKGLFFVDSLTTPKSKAGLVSREVGIPFATRQIFIDNGQDYTKTCQNLLAVIDSKKGRHNNIILIGHPYSNTIAALNKVVPELKSQGVEIVPVSSLVR